MFQWWLDSITLDEQSMGTDDTHVALPRLPRVDDLSEPRIGQKACILYNNKSKGRCDIRARFTQPNRGTYVFFNDKHHAPLDETLDHPLFLNRKRERFQDALSRDKRVSQQSPLSGLLAAKRIRIGAVTRAAQANIHGQTDEDTITKNLYTHLQVRHDIDHKDLSVPARTQFLLLLRGEHTHFNRGVYHAVQDPAAPLNRCVPLTF